MAAPNDVRDDTGDAVPPSAGGPLVSLVPSITELICDLGAGDRLVGVTRFCTEPPARIAAVEKVGGTKDPDCARIAALRPALVFVERDENRREDFEALRAAGLNVFVAHPSSVLGVASLVRRIGASIDCAASGDALAASISESIAGGAANNEAVRVFCPIWRNPWMTFNDTTYAADLIRQAGGANVCAAPETYPRVTLAEIARLDPQVVLLPDEPYVFAERHLSMLGELAATAAARDRRIHLVDGKAMFWYGRRTPAALAMLRGLFARDARSGTGNGEPGTLAD